MKSISTAAVFFIAFMVVAAIMANPVFAKWEFVGIDFTPGTLNFPEFTNLTNEYEDQGVVFSNNDTDLPPELQKSLGVMENLIFEGSLLNVFRLNFVQVVQQVRITIRDSNINSQEHCLYAINVDGNIIDVDCIFENGLLTDPFTLEVKKPGIVSVVVIEQPFGAEVAERLEFRQKIEK